MRWPQTLPLLLLLSSGALYGCGNPSATVNHASVHEAPPKSSKVQHSIWVQPANERYTPKKAWLQMSATQIAHLGADKGEQGLPLFAGMQVRRVIPKYAESILTHTQEVRMWTSAKRVTFDPKDFRMVDAWDGCLGGKRFVMDVYESTRGFKRFVLADAYNHKTVTVTAFDMPVYWMMFTGRFVAFCVPFPADGFYATLDLTTGAHITDSETAAKMAGMWESMGGQPGNISGLTKDSDAGPSCTLPSVNYKPYYYLH